MKFYAIGNNVLINADTIRTIEPCSTDAAIGLSVGMSQMGAMLYWLETNAGPVMLVDSIDTGADTVALLQREPYLLECIAMDAATLYDLEERLYWLDWVGAIKARAEFDDFVNWLDPA
jgi:hypothetical protein